MTSRAAVAPTQRRQQDLESLVQRRMRGRIHNLRLEVGAAGVVLRGRAPSFHAKQMAQHAAMELLGLPILANAIEVP